MQYATAQICKNGHIIAGDIHEGGTAKFCKDCGETTLTTCEKCSSAIRGDGYDGINVHGMYGAPNFCHECGTAFPWTTARIEAAKELADEIDDIDAETLDKAKASFELITTDNPRTALASTRITKLLAKAGPVVGNAIKDILISIATDAAKKQIGL